MDMQDIITFMEDNEIILATAESCTAGLIVSEIASIPGTGQLLDTGLAVYSPEAKNRYLGVSFDTIEKYNLTSEEVAIEMARGALKNSGANLTISNTGIAGPGSGDGDIPVGTVCFAWAFKQEGEPEVFSETKRFDGDRNEVRLAAAHYSLERIPAYYAQLTSKPPAAKNP
ncbi:CinA family protein [Phytohalomonas tamaricis]|uniref:CinA family protein n=1 Tax=Phytohalomonas tamaricis TaxID=2081032 RepID=UPI000D0B1374|nr:CinA family protein [Phytohalomonas tamaricis]